MKKMRKLIAACLAAAMVFSVTAVLCGSPALAAEENGDYKLLALTFDDGPSKYTSYLLDELAKRDAHCTFFMVGTCAAQRPEVLKRMADEGHQLGNHTYSHASLNTSNVTSQLSGCRKYLVAAGGEQTYYVRPPYGSSSSATRAYFKAPAILWSVDPYDWKYLNTNTVVNNIMSTVKDGDIILLHDLYKTSVDAALIVIDRLQAQGYEFVTVSELFRRRGVTPENGKVYTCARNNGVNLGPVKEPEPDPEYYDETKLDEHWGYEAIQFVLAEGLFTNYEDGSFGPNRYMTRGMFVTALGRLADVEAVDIEEPVFSDVDAGSEAAPYVQWAAENGIVEGYGDEKNSFGINDTITREQMATIILRYMKYAGYDTGSQTDFELKFTDSGDISEYAAEGVKYCAAIGLLKGDQNNAYDPASFTTRAQAATVFMRLWNYLVNGGETTDTPEPEPSPEPSGEPAEDPSAGQPQEPDQDNEQVPDAPVQE